MNTGMRNKILFIPDSFWGTDSGHRSSQYLLKAFNKINIDVAVYASSEFYSEKQREDLIAFKYEFYEQTPYSFKQNLFKRKIKKEFIQIVESFRPDYVLYMGTIRNKITMDFCSEMGLEYFYLPLTTEYYCVKHFAALDNGPCFKCLHGSYLNSIKNRCLGPKYNLPKYLKDILLTFISKKRILRAKGILGYSHDQLSMLEAYGVNRGNTIKTSIFFDHDTINTTSISAGDYFVCSGQLTTAKGWHLIPQIIRNTPGIKYKLIFLNEENAQRFVLENNLEKQQKSGYLDIVYGVENHQDVLDIFANARGILVPSYYATTGEFTLLEALGLGKPVILFNAGVHREVIVHRKNAMMANVGDLAAYCRHIVEVAANDDLAMELSAGGQQLYQELTSFDFFRSSMNDLFPAQVNLERQQAP